MRVKGTAIRSRLDFLRSGSVEGPVLGALSEKDRLALEVALPTSWIAVELVDRLDVEMARQCSGAGVAREYGAFSARRNLSRIYKAFVDQAGGDPLALLEGLMPLHTSFYDEGSMRVVEPEPGGCRIELDFVGSATRFRCQVSVGFFEEALRMLNVEGLSVSEESCQLSGGLHCSFALQWRAKPKPVAARAVTSAPSLTAG